MTAVIHGDCMDVMERIPNCSIDMVLSDPPYGTTACKWDTPIDLSVMWSHLKRVSKKPAAIVLFCSQPFTTTLISSNASMFKYTWVWEKEQGSMPMNAPYQPIKVHEDIAVFSQMASTYSRRGTMNYFPQKSNGHKPYKANTRRSGVFEFNTDPSGDHFNSSDGDRHPRSVQRFRTERAGLHGSQKPVALAEFLIKSYSQPGDTVLDFCAGSGSFGVACHRTGRRYIGIEIDEKIADVANSRINNEISKEE